MTCDLHIIEDMGHAYPATHANVGRSTPAVDALIATALPGGLESLHGDASPAVAITLAAALAGLDTGDPAYLAASNLLAACVAACDTSPPATTLHVNSI